MLPSFSVVALLLKKKSLRRARRATLRTSSRVSLSAMPGSRGGKRERLADDGLDDLAAADALRADPADDRALALLDADPLQIGAKGTARDAGGLAAVAAEVFRLPALGHLISADRLFIAQFA